MKTTFIELGIPFPLYEAPVEAASDCVFDGNGSCCICGKANTSCFSLGIGTALMIACPACGVANGLDVHNRAPVNCRACSASIEFPASVAGRKEPKTCYACLRAGKAALTKDTEFGMVSWDQAFSGVTNGVPGLRQDQFESVVLDAQDDWIGARLSEAIMFELLRTPTYGTWQGEHWLFCCRYPMTFVGEWLQEDFTRRAPDGDGERLLHAAIAEIPAGSWDALGCGLSVYVFECKRCGRLRAHWDSD